ncbi:V-type proton ATPase subunit S1 [Daktulosphaira vitifoliae]|uniref:V-type proton ATPase subunit S1 n=1 Tax=Daktulosphaira vitifoliae TaxID=58002 RepID=UPI0021AAD5D7|nr:V-type proton ATPase subunit S1 [Daktulosphaira vitifoliae]XP_050531966.1 V-type proton ATPase subunit S1 [Daktulosphaira vitifoliae]
MLKYINIVLLCYLACTCALSFNQVPVMLFSCGQTNLGTIAKYQHAMDSDEFTDLIMKLATKDVKFATFYENSLSLEDFRWRGIDGRSVFPLLEAFVNRRFIPSVPEPNKAIQLLKNYGYFFENFKNDVILPNLEKLVLSVELEDAKSSEERQEMLGRHDLKIVQSFEEMCEKYENVIGILTGNRNAWIESNDFAHHLVARHLMEIDDKKPLVLKGKDKVLIFSQNYPTLSINGSPAIELEEPSSAGENVYMDDSRDNMLKVTKTLMGNDSKITLRFRFVKQSFNWQLEYIELERINEKSVFLYPQKTIESQLGMSYFIEGPVVFKNDSIVLTFNGKFQVQPWIPSSTESIKFGEPQEQDAFFTPPILAGLFVTALLLFIVTWGIMMIMDIKTMDRFDDPKGKTITINVVE